jgi:ribonuclease HII
MVVVCPNQESDAENTAAHGDENSVLIQEHACPAPYAISSLYPVVTDRAFCKDEEEKSKEGEVNGTDEKPRSRYVHDVSNQTSQSYTRYSRGMQIVGIDEVGRGALAGPVVVGAVVLSSEEKIWDGLKEVLGRKPADSKQLTLKQRERGSVWLQNHISWALGQAEPSEIEELGIVGATKLAATRALEQLVGQFTHVHADASLFHSYEDQYPTERFVKGDETKLSILCASVVAKVARDSAMRELAQHHQVYGWEKNVGYGTPLHLAALREHGMSEHHRPLFCRNVVG